MVSAFFDRSLRAHKAADAANGNNFRDRVDQISRLSAAKRGEINTR
jgi:hypothetical protein